RRLVGEDHDRVGIERAAEDQLLHVAAGKQPDACFRRRAFDVVIADEFFREFARGLPVHEAAAAETRRAVAFGNDVLGDAHVADGADSVAILRDAGDALLEGRTRRPVADYAAADRDRT